MAGDPGPDLLGRSGEGELQQAWVPERSQHRGAQGAQHQQVATEQLRRQRAPLGRCAVISAAKGHGGELAEVFEAERLAAGEPDLDPLTARVVSAAQAPRDRRRVVGHQEVAGSEVVGNLCAIHVPEPTCSVHYQQVVITGLVETGDVQKRGQLVHSREDG